MAMYLRKNYTYLGVDSLVIVMQLRLRDGYARNFKNGFNPQSDYDISMLGMLMQIYESEIAPYDVMTRDEIARKWETFLTLFV